ncbi:MAG TPA: enolase C-terminal domain-like protein [Thermoplasmata archaeon]|nr:enolase C-terminal domain-like protein [Thermoplasmata archaeon]
MSRIVSADLFGVYDSRGRPTVEATIALGSGAQGRAGAPSGASTGAHEVLAFPKGGVPEAIATFQARVAPRLPGLEAEDQHEVDAALHEIDGTTDFSLIGGNTATAVSVAVAIARAEETGRPLWRLLARPGVDGRSFPAIVGNCLNGGRHAIGGPDIQEFIAFSACPRPEDSIRAVLRVHGLIGEELHRRFPKAALGRGDEGGWVAAVPNLEALEILSDACAKARDELHLDVHPGLDLAASEFFEDGKYRYREQTLDTEGQIGFVTKLVERFGIKYVEDPFEEEAFDAFAALTKAVGYRTLVVGDDLYVTNADRLRTGIERKATNAILIKVNQVGTLTDTFRAVDLARSQGLSTVTSHRSGEVPEGWLAHVALGTGARGLKCGILGGERMAKLNELLRLGRATGT